MKKKGSGILPKAVKKRSSKPKSKKQTAPRTADEFFARSPAFQDRWIRITGAVSKVRSDRISPEQAARQFGLDPRTLKKGASSALRKGKNGRYTAKASDQLFRPMVVLTPGGKQEIATRDSRQATLIAEHWNAADKYLSTGDTTELRKLQGKTVTGVDGTKYLLLTDTAELDRLGNAGVLSFESIYARVA